VHGLSAGRPGATWVTVSYVICVLFVLVGLAVRLSVSLNRRKDFSSTSTGSIKPVGSLVPTTAPSAKKRTPSRRRDAEDARVVADRGNAPAAVLETWVPAAGPTVSPVSAMPAPVSGPAYGDEYQRSSRAERYAEVDEPAPRSRQRPVDPAYVDDEMPAPRQRRAPAGERFDESTRPVSRRALEDERHRYADDEVVSAPRSRRRAAEPMIEEPEYDDPPVRSRRAIEGARSGRYAEDEPGLRPRRAADEPARSRYAEPDEPVSRARRRAAEPPMAEPGYDEVPPPRSRRYAEDEVPRQRGTGEPRRAGSHTGEIRIDPSQTGEFRLDPSQTGEFRRDQTGEFRRDQTGEFRRDQTGEFRRDPSRTGEFRMDPSRTGEFRREPRTGEFRYEDGPASPRSRPARYAEDDEVAAPRGRRDRGANVDGADSGRHSRSDFVDLAEPADPWSDVPDTNYLPADETPTLVDMASRRARRATQQDTTRGTSRGARRTKGRGADDAVDDQQYWRQLRGEAQ
jgi:hypothetical protein